MVCGTCVAASDVTPAGNFIQSEVIIHLKMSAWYNTQHRF